jgi:hydroxymethylglutaryl-CoA reductase (NADPH)
LSFVPRALLRRLYRKGSLRKTPEGIAFDLKNILGPGILTGVNFIKLNDTTYQADKIKIDTNGKRIHTDRISPENPVLFTFGQKGTCLLLGREGLIEGKNNISFELLSREAGLIQVTVSDTIQPDS